MARRRRSTLGRHRSKGGQQTPDFDRDWEGRAGTNSYPVTEYAEYGPVGPSPAVTARPKHWSMWHFVDTTRRNPSAPATQMAVPWFQRLPKLSYFGSGLPINWQFWLTEPPMLYAMRAGPDVGIQGSGLLYGDYFNLPGRLYPPHYTGISENG